MAGNYVLTFSSPFKTDTVVVPSASTGSGKNDYDTSLDLVGPGYVNYGQAFAQNFLKLLENFASPYPPNNSIEGQLWYDTSDSARKVLRVNNDIGNGSEWAPASGIYQQPNDPAVQFPGSVVDGDLWADTNNAQLKIRYGTTWRIVGPDISAGIDKTGSEFTYLESTTGQFYPVILSWANNKVITVISNNEFIPKIVIEGFTNIKIGVNLTSKNQAKYYGTAEKSESLVVNSNSTVRAADLLKNRSTAGQVHTGTFKVDSSNGLSILNSQYNHEIQIKSNASEGATIYFNSPDLTKKLRAGIENYAYITFSPETGSIGINTGTNNSSPAFEVNGESFFRGKLVVYQPVLNAFEVQGKSIFSSDIAAAGNLYIAGKTTASGILTLGTSTDNSIKTILTPAKHGLYDIGSTSTRFRWIYAQNVGYNVNNTGTATTTFYGRLEGTATKLATKREIIIKGQVTGTSVLFDGSSNIEFTTTLTSYVFTQNVSINSATAFHSLITLNTSTTTSVVEVISKREFLNDVTVGMTPTGSVLPFFGNTSTVETILKPDGNPSWLVCYRDPSGSSGQGRLLSTSTYRDLWLSVQYKFGGSGLQFRLPDMTTATSIYVGSPLYYIIKT